MSKKKVIAIVQCRVNSTRLPGKALLPLVGEMSILEFLLQRLLLANHLDDVIVTTGHQKCNDPIEDIAKKLNVKCLRGTENNVLQRFVDASNHLNADVIVRVCADNPLTDPFLIDELITLFLNQSNIDHLATFAEPSVPYGVGCAIFSKHALDKTHANCLADDESLEHVEPYMLQSQEINTFHYRDQGERHMPDLRVTVDHQWDYDYVKPIAEALVRRYSMKFTTAHLVKMTSRPKLAVFANANLGLEGVRFFKESGADIRALILHPANKAQLREEIKSVISIDPENVIDYTQISEHGIEWFEDKRIDICMSLWSSYIFKKDLIELFPLGVYNLHNSLLPSLGGCGANIWTILLGQEYLGATLHRISVEIDQGPIIEQRKRAISYESTGQTVFNAQQELMVQILKDRWRDLAIGNYTYKEPSTQQSYFSAAQRDSKKELHLDKSTTVGELLNVLRAYDFGDKDAAYFVDKNGKHWDVRIQINERKRIKGIK